MFGPSLAATELPFAGNACPVGNNLILFNTQMQGLSLTLFNYFAFQRAQFAMFEDHLPSLDMQHVQESRLFAFEPDPL